MPEDKETTQPLIEDTPKETPLVTPDVHTTTKPDIKTVESNDNDAIGRLNGRIDELERKYEQRGPEKVEARTPDSAPKPSHPWFRNPFVSG